MLAPINKRGESPIFKQGKPIEITTSEQKPGLPGDTISIGGAVGAKAVTPAQVKAAFERLDAANKRVLATSLGTLGAFPAHEKALAEQKEAKAAIAELRKAAPELVAAEEKGRAEKAGGLFDFFKKWMLVPLAPVPALALMLFGKKD